MATTNAAITQANNSLAQLNAAARAQQAAEAGVAPVSNLGRMNKNYNAAASGFRAVSNKMAKLNLPAIAKNFSNAANAAEAASAAKSARQAAMGLSKIQNAMLTNLNRVNQNLPPASNAGIQ